MGNSATAKKGDPAENGMHLACDFVLLCETLGSAVRIN